MEALRPFTLLHMIAGIGSSHAVAMHGRHLQSSTVRSDPACPCIDPYPLLGPGTNQSTCSGVLRGDECYNRDYGANGCRQYDSAAADECQVDEPPEWCRKRWCYVAPWNCLRPNSPSSFFDGVVIGNRSILAESGMNCTDSGYCSTDGATLSNRLAYSYETCGNIDTFTYENALADALASISSRGKLRLSIPGNEPPFTTTLGADDDYLQGTSMRDGSVPRFVARILAGYGLEWEEVAISDESRAFSPDSALTACVHDVALNRTDICAASIFAFEYRRRLADFTAPFAVSPQYVVAKKASKESQSFAALMFRPFQPFDIFMWLGLFGALVYAGYGFYQLDATGFDSDDEDDDEDLAVDKPAVRRKSLHARTSLPAPTPPPLPAPTSPSFPPGGHPPPPRPLVRQLTKDQLKQVKYERDWKHIFCPTTLDDAEDLALSMAKSVQAYLSGGDFRFEPRSPQAWIVFIGFSFLILVTTANYTAQVTAANVVGASQASITSLEQGISRGYKFCGWASLSEPIIAAYPALSGLYVGLEDGRDAFRAMDNGVCDAAIIDDLAWEAAKGGLYSQPQDDARYANHPKGPERWHCDTKTMLPQLVHSIDTALAVRSDLARPLSWAVTKALSKGQWAEEQATARRRFIAPSACSLDGEVKTYESLGFSNGAGIIIFSILTTTMGLVINAIWRLSPTQKAARRASRLQQDMNAAARALAATGAGRRISAAGRRISHIRRPSFSDITSRRPSFSDITATTGTTRETKRKSVTIDPGEKLKDGSSVPPCGLQETMNHQRLETIMSCRQDEDSGCEVQQIHRF